MMGVNESLTADVVQYDKLFPQLFLIFYVLRIGNDGVIDRAHLLAGWRIVMPNALSTAINIDLVNLIPHRNCLIWAFWLAHVAINTFACD